MSWPFDQFALVWLIKASGIIFAVELKTVQGMFFIFWLRFIPFLLKRPFFTIEMSWHGDWLHQSRGYKISWNILKKTLMKNKTIQIASACP